MVCSLPTSRKAARLSSLFGLLVVGIVLVALSTPTTGFAHVHFRMPLRITTLAETPNGTLLSNNPQETVETVEEAIEALEEMQDVKEAIGVLVQHKQQGKELDADGGDDSQNIVIRQSAQKLKLLEDIKNFKRDDIAGDIQALIEENETDDIVGTITDIILSMVSQEEVEDEQRTTEEAAVSASLYMNPATPNLWSNLVISWEPAVAEILDHMSRVCNPGRPFMVGVVGIPGSGKSTSCEIVASLLAQNAQDDEEHTLIMPMDGFHLPLQALAEMPNAADMIYRRGAPDTFDPEALARELERIAYGNETTVTIPGFDHAKGDPIQGQHTFNRDVHKLVICEGIYLLHDDDGWESIRSFFDWTLYIDADVDNCIARLKERNKCIPGYTPEEIETRCEIVDRNNALTARDAAKKYASQIVQSGAM